MADPAIPARTLKVRTKANARAVVADWLAARGGEDLVLLDEATRSTDAGWVFFYERRQLVDALDPRDVLTGARSVVVDREGVVHVTGAG